jgi:hypothetical protein
MRNAFIKAFLDKGVKDPVVATVSRTRGQNIVVSTTNQFSADFLLEKKSIWEHILHFESAQKDEPWHKVVIHGIPTADFNTPDGMALIVDEIKTFNKGLTPIGTPYWLTPAEKRHSQRAGSVVVAFASPEVGECRFASSVEISTPLSNMFATPARPRELGAHTWYPNAPTALDLTQQTTSLAKPCSPSRQRQLIPFLYD